MLNYADDGILIAPCSDSVAILCGAWRHTAVALQRNVMDEVSIIPEILDSPQL